MTITRSWPAMFTVAFLAGVAPGIAVGDDWPQWRGPERNGQVGGPSWPDRLTEDSLEGLWRIPLGTSYSGPLVTEDSVFTTATEDKEIEVVLALDRATGAERWRAEWDGAMKVPFFARSNGSWIRATPAYDGEHLYVAGIRDVLVCLDAVSGTEVWRVDFVGQLDTPLPAFGYVSSPLVDGEALYAQAGGAVIRLHKRTGEILWRAMEDGGGMGGSAFSSPIIAELAGQRQLVVQTRERLVGLDLGTGDELWSRVVPAYRGMNILTPLVHEDRIFTSSYRNQSWLFGIAREDEVFRVSEVWNNEAKGYMSSPVLIGGHVYLHLQNERFTCIDVTSGEQTWTSTPYGKYASLVAQGDRILALNNRGTLLYLEANPESFALIDSVTISDQQTWAHLAVSGEELFIRELNALSAFRWTANGH